MRGRVVFTGMDTSRELDRLNEAGARFSISIGPRGGFQVMLGNYAREVSPRLETPSIEEAVCWLRAHVALQRRQ